MAANLLVFAMFTNPAVSVITDEKERVEALRATQENSLAMAQYRGRVRAAESEQQYDVDGNPLEKKILIPPEEIKPAARGELAGKARAQYYTQLGLKISRDLADSAGVLLIALFLLLMANFCFIDELFAVCRKDETFS